MYNIVIGIQTCNRIEFTKQTIESIIKHNPDSLYKSWVVSDDGSTDGTVEYLKSLSFIDKIITHPVQSGITLGLKRLVSDSLFYGDILMYIQNDWKQIRPIDFDDIEKFFKDYPKAGHIQMIRYKGKNGADRPSGSALLINNYTKEKIKPGIPIKLRKEIIIPGNWHYADIPGFTRLTYANKMFSNMLDEGERVKLLHQSGCEFYLLDNQPFINMDYIGSSATPKRKF
jgi:glycosyltransferase involved in cell wall biosynthesis